MSNKITYKKIILCLFGMFVYASGVAITKNCNLGISPITSTAYALSLITGITMGWCTSIINLFYFAIQRILLKNEYALKTLLGQIIMSLLFSVFIDIAAIAWSFVNPTNYIIRIVIFMVGLFVLALGMCIIIKVNFVILPAEGAIMAIVKRFNFEFPKTKICCDIGMVLLTVVISLIFLREIVGVREGTLISMIVIGLFARLISPVLDKLLISKS